MKDGIRTICYDQQLQIEAYRFQGVMQPFPNHFHDYYVIGYIEKGLRQMACRQETFAVKTGDLILLNPGDNHRCKPLGDEPLDYRCLNIKAEVMTALATDITGHRGRVSFQKPLLRQCSKVPLLHEVHCGIMAGRKDFGKEEGVLLLLEQLIADYGVRQQEEQDIRENPVDRVCLWLEAHCHEPVSLDRLSQRFGQNKYSLIRAFTKSKGITPYRYLTNLRIGRAKAMLEQGVEPIDCGLETGFSDQSHFTTTFRELLGLTPKQYQNIFMETSHGRSS